MSIIWRRSFYSGIFCSILLSHGCIAEFAALRLSIGFDQTTHGNVNSIALHATHTRNVLLVDSLCFVVESNNKTSTAFILCICNHRQRDMICVEGFILQCFINEDTNVWPMQCNRPSLSFRPSTKASYYRLYFYQESAIILSVFDYNGKCEFPKSEAE